MDGVADGGWCGDRVFYRGWCMNGKMEGDVQGTMFLGHACLKYGKVTNLSPVSNLDVSSVGDRMVISHLPNICR